MCFLPNTTCVAASLGDKEAFVAANNAIVFVRAVSAASIIKALGYKEPPAFIIFNFTSFNLPINLRRGWSVLRLLC